MKSRLLAAVAIGAVFLVAPASAQVKIGILNDQSRVYANSGGKYSLEAARMAVEDFGGEVLGPEDRDRHCGPPEQARSRHRDCPALV